MWLASWLVEPLKGITRDLGTHPAASKAGWEADGVMDKVTQPENSKRAMIVVVAPMGAMAMCDIGSVSSCKV